MKKKIAVIGAGASGIISAICCAEKKEFEVVLIEKNERIGKKLLATGNGKCNITNDNILPSAYKNDLVLPTMEKFDAEKTKEFFSSLGLIIKSDSFGRCYPYSESANSVLNILLSALKNSAVKIITSFEVDEIKKEKGRFVISGNQKISADSVILCTGSKASVKSCNTNEILDKLGISYRPFSPALCPLPSEEEFLKSLKGVRAKGTVTLAQRTEKGEIQFNEKNISGICVFNLSAFVKNGDTVFIDFLADFSNEQILSYLKARIKKNEFLTYENLLDGFLLKKLSLTIIKRAGFKPTEKANERELDKIISIAKKFSVKVDKPDDFRFAQVCTGGVTENEININTLESKKYHGLFLCGEMLDVDGPCGGYNLQWAFSSAMNASQNVINYLTEEKN